MVRLRPLLPVGLLLLLAIVIGGCHGVIGDAGTSAGSSGTGPPGPASGTGTGTGAGPGSGTGTGGGADPCAGMVTVLRVGRTLLRRMTRLQFDNTVRDLLGVAGDPAAGIAPDERIGPFYSNGIAP